MLVLGNNFLQKIFPNKENSATAEPSDSQRAARALILNS